MLLSCRTLCTDLMLAVLYYYSIQHFSIQSTLAPPLQVLDSASGLLFGGFRNDTTKYSTYPDCPYNSTQFNDVTFVYFTLFYRIENIAVWKVPLFEWMPTDFGIFYHAYLVLETIDTYGNFHYWSFEKNSKFLILQQTPWVTKRNVVNGLNGKPRLKGNYWKPTLLIEEEFIIAASTLFNFYNSAEIKRHNNKYNLMFLNCKHFTQEMFNLLTHKEKWDCSIETILLNAYNSLMTTQNIFSTVLWLLSSVLMRVSIGIRLSISVWICLGLVVILQWHDKKELLSSNENSWKGKYVTLKKWKPKLKKWIYIEP